MRTHISQISSYLAKGFNDTDQTVSVAVKKLRLIPFDTIVCRGFSGMMIAPLVARKMGKTVLCVRKELSHHGNMYGEGELGRDWIFLDDFCSSGATLDACKEAVRSIVHWHNDFESTYVGMYEYNKERFEFCSERFPREVVPVRNPNKII